MADPSPHEPERLDLKKDEDDKNSSNSDSSRDLCVIKSDETSEIPFELSERTLSISSVESSQSHSSGESKVSVTDSVPAASTESKSPVAPVASTESTEPTAPTVTTVPIVTPVSTELLPQSSTSTSSFESKLTQEKSLLTRNGIRSTWEPKSHSKAIAKRSRSRSTSRLNPFKKSRKTYQPCKLSCLANFCGCSSGREEKPYLLAPLDIIKDSIQKSQYRHKFINELNSFSLDPKFLNGLITRDKLKISRKARATTPKPTVISSKEMKCIRLMKSIDHLIKQKSRSQKEEPKDRIERIINDLKSTNNETDSTKLVCSSCTEKFCGCVSSDELLKPDQINDCILRDQYFFKIIYEFVDNEFQETSEPTKAFSKVDAKSIKEEIIEAIEKKTGVEPSSSKEMRENVRRQRRSRIRSKSKSKSKSGSKSRSRSKSESKSKASSIPRRSPRLQPKRK